MRRKLLTALAAVAILGGITVYAVIATNPAKASAATSWSCTPDHWFRDISAGDQLVSINATGYHLVDATGAGYPAGYVFNLCTNMNGTYYLQIQDPKPTVYGADWVGVNTLAHYAITASATNPGPHEAFSIACVGPHEEHIDWLYGGNMFTISTMGLYAPPQSIGLPGTVYQLSGVC